MVGVTGEEEKVELVISAGKRIAVAVDQRAGPVVHGVAVERRAVVGVIERLTELPRGGERGEVP